MVNGKKKGERKMNESGRKLLKIVSEHPVQVDELTPTERGNGGFSSTGKR